MSIERIKTLRSIQPKKYKIGKLLGTGAFANVYMNDGEEVAIKISRPKTDEDDAIWSETYILNNLINPLITTDTCMNLLYTISTFKIELFTMTLTKGEYSGPCNIIIMEKADGTLQTYFSIKRNVNECYTALFQILYALYHLQSYYQIHHSDIKSTNILYRKTDTKLIEYVVKGKNYTIPTYGVLFFISDFGVSSSYSPKYPTNDYYHYLGTRSKYIINNSFKPIKYSGSEPRLTMFSMTKKGSLPCYNVIVPLEHARFFPVLQTTLEYFLSPELIPPLEFINDTQDVLKIFVGGQRSISSRQHIPLDIPIVVKNYLEEFIYKGEFLEPYHVLASYLIHRLFTQDNTVLVSNPTA